MKQHNKNYRLIFSMFTGIILVPAFASAHGGHAHTSAGAAPKLHVGNEYDDCYFDLHPELTQHQFGVFAAEVNAIGRFMQLTAPQTLGTNGWSLSLAISATPMNDAKGAWNNTFSHPKDDHYLGDLRQIPRLIVHYGVMQHLDLGLWGTVNPASNFGLVGIDAKIGVYDDVVGDVPVYVAFRPSASSVVGPKEVWFGNLAADLTAGIRVVGLSPYVGVGGTLGVAVEKSKDVALDPAITFKPVGVTGLSYKIGYFHAAAEATWSTVQTFGLSLGASI